MNKQLKITLLINQCKNFGEVQVEINLKIFDLVSNINLENQQIINFVFYFPNFENRKIFKNEKDLFEFLNKQNLT